jgi:competence protein ComFC
MVAMCGDCPPPPISSARAPFLYEGPAREAVHRLKFSGWRDVAGALAAAILACEGIPECDVVTWVPLARRRRSERGYDQARALAAAVARERRSPLVALLRRAVATGPQARRHGLERRDAMRGAFEAARRARGRVLLVDDVLTTGSTAAACAEALSAAGASEVHVVAAARAFDARAPALRPDGGRAYPRSGPRPGLWLPGDPPR